MKSERLSRKSNIRKISRAALACEEVTILPATATYDLIEDEAGVTLKSIDARAIKLYSNLEAVPYGFEKEADILHWVAAMTTESPQAWALFKFAQEQGWRVRMANLSTGGFHLNIPDRTLELDHGGLSPSALGRSVFFRCAILMSFIRGLRDVWQEEKLGGAEAIYRPETFLAIERVRAADCDVVAVLAAWELRGAGYGELWRHMLGSDDGDLCLTFGCALEKSPASLYDGKALGKTFAQWFEDDLRVDAADHEALEYLDILLENGEATDILGQQSIGAAQIESLSMLPDGMQYLKGMGEDILRAPAYAGLNDPINQSHLFHIVYDTQVVMVGGVPFNDARLARKIFPGAAVKKIS